MKKDLLTLNDFEESDFQALFDRALELKKRHKAGIFDTPLAGKSVGLMFDKPSTRTRISFEAATVQLAGTPIFMSAKDTQISRNETIYDTAKVLSRYIDCLVIRTYSQEKIEEYARTADIPVINALSDLYHPCQILSDLLTVIEYKGGYKDIKISWIGDGNNVAHSWIYAASVLDMNLHLACPPDYSPDKAVLDAALAKGKGKITVTTDPVAAAKDADIIYTDVWASMGQEEEQDARIDVFKPYQVNNELMAHAAKDASVMHCLPAHREEEITGEVLDGPNSIIWDQAENKLHMHKAILETFINRKQ